MRTPPDETGESLLLGRASEVETIVENCKASRLTVVTGVPGLGMSSLLRIGAAPALREAGFITLVYADWQGRSLAAQFRQAIGSTIVDELDGPYPSGSEPLCDLLERAQRKAGRPIALLLDQFEDYLRYHSGTDISDDFDAELARAICSRVGRFVIGMHQREVEILQRLNPYVPNLMGFSFALEPLTPEVATQLVRAVAAGANIAVEPAAMELLVTAPRATLRRGTPAAGVHPLFLKLAAESLFQAESQMRSKTARASTVMSKGGPDRLILESLDPVMNGLGRNMSGLFFRWVPLLLARDGRRLLAREKALVGDESYRNRSAPALLQQLLQCGLLRKVEMPTGVRYEFAGESMTIVIRDWWNRRLAQFEARERLLFRIGLISIGVGAILAAYFIYRSLSLFNGF